MKNSHEQFCVFDKLLPLLDHTDKHSETLLDCYIFFIFLVCLHVYLFTDYIYILYC